MSSKLTFIDPISKKPIEYDDNTIFGIYTKAKWGRKYPRRFFESSRISEALKEFYNLDVPISHRKHLMMFPSKEEVNLKSGTLLLSMEGYLPNIRDFQLDVTTPKKSHEYRKVATLNLINTPEAIAIKLRGLDFSKFPLVSERWTQTKVVYSLLSYFLSLNDEDKNELIRKAFYCYLQDKLASKGREEDIKYITELKPIVQELEELL
jgi:hypothetical protein